MPVLQVAIAIESTLRGVLTAEDTTAAKEPHRHAGAGQTGGNYWAKGTGFGTGSTQASWNMDAAYQKQKFEEKNISCLLKVTDFLAIFMPF